MMNGPSGRKAGKYADQIVIYLEHLKNKGLLRFEIDYSHLRLIYGTETAKVHPNPPFDALFTAMQQRNYITKSIDIDSDDYWTFNVKRVNKLLSLKQKSPDREQQTKAGSTSSNATNKAQQKTNNQQTPGKNIKTKQSVIPHEMRQKAGATLNKTSKNQPGNSQHEASTSSHKSNSERGGLFIDQKFNFPIKNKSRPTTQSSSTINCKVCGSEFENQSDLKHHQDTSDEHAFKKLYLESRVSQSSVYSKPPPSLSGESHGVTIQNLDEGSAATRFHTCMTEDQAEKGSATIAVTLVVQYKKIIESSRPLNLARTFIIHGKPKIRLRNKQKPVEAIKEGKGTRKIFDITENTVGDSIYIVAFKFFYQNPYEVFYVMKRICVRVDSDVTMNLDTPANTVKKPATPAKKSKQGKSTNRSSDSPQPDDFILTTPPVIEEADRPNLNKGELKYKKLKEYELPANYTRFFNCGFNVYARNITPNMLHLKREVLEILVGNLTKANYGDFFSLLLYLEEHQTLCDLKAHSLKDATLSQDKKSKNINILVPGLAEARPSVLRGDKIHLLVKNEGVYSGFVRDTERNTLSVRMGPKFMAKFINNMKACVYFTFNRSSLRYEHNAMELLKSNGQVKQICFPTTYGKYKKDEPITSWYNRLVSTNPEQRQAVQNILNGTSLPSPYLLFGPPGTGKTVTLVETMAQIFRNESSYILATAPSNAAADVLAERLVKILPCSKILRMYSPSREWSQVPEALKRISNFVDQDVVFPALSELKKFRVIIATLICAGRLMRGSFPEGHFTHIFVDECGHGMEPTALVPVAGLLGREPKPGQLVLSGDPRQLGPIIRSPVAKQLGLGLSLLERLMTSCNLYQKKNGQYNPQVLTKLVKNFRSHPIILKVPNELFYDGELEPCGEEGMTHSLCEWDGLTRRGVPIIFHGIEGQETKDEGTPSLFNIAEVNKVVQYVESILDAKIRGQRLRPADIGVISPYRAQITKLHTALQKRKIANIQELTVGSVEEFQGQERRVIIVSTVRSNPAQVSLDRKYRLGFVKEPKRFNVAVTRAKALVIIVGNPQVLETDVNWRRLLEWSLQCGAYKGCKFSLSPASELTLEPEEDELSPVKELLQQQLALCKEALKHQLDKANKWKPDTDLDLIMEQIKNLSFLSEASELQKQVSPPFNTFEQ